MFRVRVRIDPERLRARAESVRSGLPGVAYVLTDPTVEMAALGCKGMPCNDRARAAVARIENVTQRYGKAIALDAITLELPAGCMVGLIGPDGVGKSSLLSMVAGARQIQSGASSSSTATWRCGASGRGLPTHRLYAARIGQESLCRISASRENIEFFGRLFGQSRAEREWRIAELLAKHRPRAFADRPAKKLSGGMRQKLGLCCCAHSRSRSPDPRRADDRRRSAVAPPILGSDRPHARRAARA